VIGVGSEPRLCHRSDRRRRRSSNTSRTATMTSGAKRFTTDTPASMIDRLDLPLLDTAGACARRAARWRHPRRRRLAPTGWARRRPLPARAPSHGAARRTA
jgi:hypothetical protein